MHLMAYYYIIILFFSLDRAAREVKIKWELAFEDFYRLAPFF